MRACPVCVDTSEQLVDLDAIQTPTLVICGDQNPCLDFDLVNASMDHLPEGSELVVIPGASQAVVIEAHFYCEFQNNLLTYLGE